MKKLAFVLLLAFSVLVSLIPQAHALSVTATSGSAAAIQAAVDQVAAAGGGDVHIPEGTFNFYESDDVWAPVTMPAGVNIFGAPTQKDADGQVVEWKTILVMPFEAPHGSTWFEYEINNNMPFRFSDLKLVGYRYYNTSSVTTYTGISITGPYTSYPVEGVIDFRIDHCHFQDMCRSALWIGPHAEHNRRVYSGVIDHSIFNNTYGIPAPYADATLGYGIGVRRWACDFWDYDTSNVVGHYNNYTIFVEDNYFSKWRHGVCSNDGIHYVFRHNIVEGDYGYASIDGHGSYADDSHSYAVGTRAIEAYENIFRNPDTTWTSVPWAINHRGGAGIFFNNTIEGYYALMDLNNDWGNYEPYCPHCRIYDTYIWDNELGGGKIIKYNSDSQEDEHYFLRPPSIAEDGWEYTPYPYPHPLTVDSSSKHSLWGTLLDADSLPVQSQISVYIEDTDTLITSGQTDTSGSYDLQIQPGVFDIAYRILDTDFYVPDFLLRFYSINVNSSIQNLIKTITDYPTEKKIAFTVNATQKQRIQTYSHIKPKRVVVNGTPLTEVQSLISLIDNTWFYDETQQRLHVIVNTTSLPTISKLHTEGRWLKDEDGNTIQLIGYGGGVQTLSPSPVGLWERNGSTQHYMWDFDEQAIIENLDAMKASGANTIRSHLAMWWIKNNGKTLSELGLSHWQDPSGGTEPITYKENTRRIIQLAGERGIYVILDGMTITPDFLNGGGQDALPYPPYQDDESDPALAQSVIANSQEFIDLWLEFALYLKDLPNVIFEPWNEPHAPSEYDEATVRDEWFNLMHDFVQTFRDNGIYQPIVIHWSYGCYVNWNYPDNPDGKMSWVDQANSTINDPIQNLIFSTHLYRSGGAFGVYSLGQARHEYDDVKQAMEHELIYENSQKYPVLIGEIGARTTLVDSPENETIALENALTVLDEWDIGWLVYWWRASGPFILFDGLTYQFNPEINFNANGIIVRDAMAE